MFRSASCVLVIAIAVATVPADQVDPQRQTRLSGDPRVSPDGTASYLDLRPTINFSKGEKLRITLGATAAKVVVRLLPQGASPNSAQGIEGGIRDVPPGEPRVIELTLTVDHPNVTQISVHGGNQSLWEGLYFLGEKNGPARLVSVDRIRPR